MRLLDKYIIYSSVFALFTEAFSFHFVIDVKLYYVILLTNFFLLATNKSITIHKNLIVILGFLLLHGVINYLWLLNPIQSLIAQLLGISISSIYYHNLIKYFSVKKLFEVYLDFSFYIAIISIFMFYLSINSFSAHRLNGVMSEPAHYAAIMLPSLYVFLRRKNYLKLFIILLTVLLSKSSIGYIGIALVIIMPLLKAKYFLKYFIVVVVVIGGSIFYLSTVWNEPISENNSNALVRRLKQTNESLKSVYTGSFKNDINLSSYAFLSNAYITRNIVYNNPLGAGIGSYRHEYDKYYGTMKPPKYLKTTLKKINRTDANSLFLRMVADLGIFAILLLAYFFYRTLKIFGSDGKISSQATFFYLVIKLIREGHYFPPEFYFFLLIFLKEFDEDIAYS
tara:strand:- start:1587 stop:2771 length:1185 start_codon:yes stop_codon:yes gene_type:complete